MSLVMKTYKIWMLDNQKEIREWLKDQFGLPLPGTWGLGFNSMVQFYHEKDMIATKEKWGDAILDHSPSAEELNPGATAFREELEESKDSDVWAVHGDILSDRLWAQRAKIFSVEADACAYFNSSGNTRLTHWSKGKLVSIDQTRRNGFVPKDAKITVISWPEL